MKRLFLLLLPMAAVLSSCNKSSNTEVEETPPQTIFFADYNITQNQVRHIINGVDKIVKKYVEDGSVPGVSVEANLDGSHTMTIAYTTEVTISSVAFHTPSGKVKVKITGTSFIADDAVKVIDVSELVLTTQDIYLTPYTYEGTVAVANSSISGDVYNQSVQYNGFGIRIKDASEVALLFSTFSFDYKSNRSLSPSFSWDNAIGGGTHNKYGAFTASISSTVEVEAGFYKSGSYTFTAEKISSYSPIVVQLGASGLGTLSITHNGETLHYSTF